MSDTTVMGLNNFLLLKSQILQRLGRGHRSSITANSGQAVIEYMLLIFVSVTLVITLATSLFQPLGQFVENLNRQYIQCLLETGELPQLSSENQTVICFEELPRFATLDADGNPIPRDRTGSGSGERNEAQATRDGQTSNVSGSASGSRPSRVGGGVGVSRGNASSEKRADKTTIIPVDNSFNEGSGFTNSGSLGQVSRSKRKKTRQIAIASLTDSERKNLERDIEKTQKTPVEGDEGFTKQKKKIIVKPPPPAKADSDIKIDVGFGYYIKIFLIIIFILFVIIVFGGQAYQMSKNWGNS